MAKLNSLCNLFTDGDWIESKDQSESGIRLIQTGNIGEGYFIEKEDKGKYISEDTFERLKCEEVFPGDILISRLPEPVGRACILPEKTERMITAVDCSICRIKENLIDKKYLCYFFQSNNYYKQLENNVTGTTRKRISRKNLGEVEVNIPSLKIQNEIINVLDKLTVIIDAKKQELEELDNLIKSRFVEMFGSIHESKFPKCRLKDVAHIKHGYAFSGEYFSEEDNNIVLVTPGNFALGGGFQEIRNKYFTSDYSEEYVLQPGDLIVTMTDLSKNADTLGYGAIVPDTGKVYLHNQRIGLFDQLDSKLNPIFVRWFMQTDEYRLEIVRTSTGSTVHHTSPDRILNSIIYLPSIELQKEFVAFANQVDKLKSEVQKSLEETQTLMDSLMQQYFG